MEKKIKTNKCRFEVLLFYYKLEAPLLKKIKRLLFENYR
jgi:hypothetical protein